MGVVRAVTVAVALTILVLIPAGLWAERAAAAQISEPPRWRYLAQAAAWAGCTAAGGILAAHLADEQWAASAIAVLSLWSGIVAVGMLGRAVCWGRARLTFWWHDPAWLTGRQNAQPVAPNPAR
jgi:hypothetical protein